MKKNYGLKVGDKVKMKTATENGKVGEIIRIFPARKNGLGFVHAEVKWPDQGSGWMTGLAHLQKID